MGDLRRHRRALIEEYEALREAVVKGMSARSQRSALALFAQGGMMAWMQAWGAVLPVKRPEGVSRDEATHATALRPEERPSWSAARAEVTVVLAGMVIESLLS